MSRAEPVRIDQSSESPLRTEEGTDFRYSYAFAPSADSQRDDEPGQDYLTFSDLGRRFVFAACDGVSQSFYGNLAARFLGDKLVAWLAQRSPAPVDSDILKSEMAGYLTDLTAIATEQVEGHPIPTEPALLHDVLLEKQARGSETMFVCGRVDLPDAGFPDGRIMLFWMGDMRVHLWRGDERVDLGDYEASPRWSSRLGPVGGEARLYHESLTPDMPFTRLIVYSDGLSLLDPIISRQLPVYSLQEIIEDTKTRPDSDDVTYFALAVA